MKTCGTLYIKKTHLSPSHFHYNLANSPKSYYLHNFNFLPILVSSTRLNHHTKSLIMKS
ncbi:hypothetical protein Syun_019931 [Stephania yunnanensis]|uniref:Uncharacterized protein n=1 Tax=Stephania yunnanensis TaxID=152371 RepID=A0AAP0IV43_9MAGN